MTITEAPTQPLIYAGVDTHQLFHHAAVVDADDRVWGEREFPVSRAGYAELTDWVAGFGLIAKVGVESTGGYGAGLTRHLLGAGIEVVEVTSPERATRAREGKSDVLDAISAARQTRTGRAAATPKIKTGAVEALRMVKIPRDSAVKDRTRAYSQLRDLVTTAPADIHDELIGLTNPQRVKKALAWRPDPTRLEDPTQAAKHALKTLARRIQALNEEVKTADRTITRLTRRLVPNLLALRQVGPQTAARLAITAGQNIARMRSEASFAKLVGVAPLPASSGKKSHRHRLNRGGDRHANSALYLMVVGRLKDHPETIAYRQRREAQGLAELDIIRCLKRYAARETYHALRADLMTP